MEHEIKRINYIFKIFFEIDKPMNQEPTAPLGKPWRGLWLTVPVTHISLELSRGHLHGRGREQKKAEMHKDHMRFYLSLTYTESGKRRYVQKRKQDSCHF